MNVLVINQFYPIRLVKSIEVDFLYQFNWILEILIKLGFFPSNRNCLGLVYTMTKFVLI
jgi:hypothetical protein